MKQLLFILSFLCLFLSVKAQENAITKTLHGLVDVSKIKNKIAGQRVILDSAGLKGGWVLSNESGLVDDGGIIIKLPGTSDWFIKRDISNSTYGELNWFNIPQNTTSTDKINKAVSTLQKFNLWLHVNSGKYITDSLRITKAGFKISLDDSAFITRPSGSLIQTSGLIQIAANNVTITGGNLADNGVSTKVINAGHVVAGVSSFKMTGLEIKNVKIVCTNGGSSAIAIGWNDRAVVENCTVENRASTQSDVLSWGIMYHANNTLSDGSYRTQIIGNRIIGFYDGIIGYGTGPRYQANIRDNDVVGCKRYGIMAYHSQASRITNNRVDSCLIGIWSDSGPTSGYKNDAEGNIVSGNTTKYNSGYGIMTEQLIGGVVSGNTSDSNGVAGILIGGGTYGATISNNATFGNSGYGIWIERNHNPVNNYIWDLSISNNVIKLNGKHGLKIQGTQKAVNVTGNVIMDNGVSAVDSASSEYAGIWIGKDDARTGAVTDSTWDTENGTSARMVNITGNFIGDSLPPPSGAGRVGKQAYGIFLQNNGVANRTTITNNRFYSNLKSQIKSNDRQILLAGNTYEGSASISVDSTKTDFVLNYGTKKEKGYLSYQDGSSLNMPGGYGQTHLILRGVSIWIDNDGRIRYSADTILDNRDGHLVLDETTNFDKKILTGASVTLDSSYDIYLANNNSSDAYVTLPQPGASGIWNGSTKQSHIFTIFNSTGTVNNYKTYLISPTTFNNIAGNDTLVIPRYSSVSVQANFAGTANTWIVLNGGDTARYISNQTAQQPLSNYNISGNGTIGGKLKIGTTLVGASSDSILVKNSSDSTVKAIAPLPLLDQGLFTSTLTNTTNIASSTFSSAVYKRQGNVVECRITGALTPSASGTATILDFTLPVNPGGTTQYYAGTIVFGSAVGYMPGQVDVNASSGTAHFISGTTTDSGDFTIIILYTIN